jgi:hypothetical protein
MYHGLGGGGYMATMTPYGMMEGRNFADIQRRVEECNLEKKKQEDKSNPYNADLVIEKDEMVNGYKMIGSKEPYMPEDMYNSIVEIWKNSKDCESIDEFLDKNEFCSDWNKQDEYGECYGGYWKYPDGSYEKENAFRLSGRKNLMELYNLPYPDDVLIESVRIGCGCRRESVLESNMLCEWVYRKYMILNNGETLRYQNFRLIGYLMNTLI